MNVKSMKPIDQDCVEFRNVTNFEVDAWVNAFQTMGDWEHSFFVSTMSDKWFHHATKTIDKHNCLHFYLVVCVFVCAWWLLLQQIIICLSNGTNKYVIDNNNWIVPPWNFPEIDYIKMKNNMMKIIRSQGNKQNKCDQPHIHQWWTQNSSYSQHFQLILKIGFGECNCCCTRNIGIFQFSY